jgi:CRP-like cAMP-binding protein
MEQDLKRNRLLACLPERCVEGLVRSATRVQLALGDGLYQRDERPRHLYFLTAGIGSVVFNSERGTTVELTTQGNEGLIGWANLLGPGLTQGDCTMQIPGEGYRVSLAVVQHEFDTVPETRQRILEYGQHQVIVANQILACNRLHRAEARFARWLLMVADRIQCDNLPMTQEFMSGMLGTRRTTVAEISSVLARAGAVEGRRGGLRIADRKALERRACECYFILRSRFDALYSHPLRPIDRPS